MSTITHPVPFTARLAALFGLSHSFQNLGSAHTKPVKVAKPKVETEEDFEEDNGEEESLSIEQRFDAAIAKGKRFAKVVFDVQNDTSGDFTDQVIRLASDNSRVENLQFVYYNDEYNEEWDYFALLTLKPLPQSHQG